MSGGRRVGDAGGDNDGDGDSSDGGSEVPIPLSLRRPVMSFNAATPAANTEMIARNTVTSATAASAWAIRTNRRFERRVKASGGNANGSRVGKPKKNSAAAAGNECGGDGRRNNRRGRVEPAVDWRKPPTRAVDAATATTSS
jgi:hypothetical protein